MTEAVQPHRFHISGLKTKLSSLDFVRVNDKSGDQESNTHPRLKKRNTLKGANRPEQIILSVISPINKISGMLKTMTAGACNMALSLEHGAYNLILPLPSERNTCFGPDASWLLLIRAARAGSTPVNCLGSLVTNPLTLCT